MAMVTNILPLAISLSYAAMAPFTKVEESFNMQAIHDLMHHMWDIEKYDHHVFPGVVPRTFIGSIVLAIVSKPFAVLFDPLFGRCDRLVALYIVRFALGIISFLCFNRFRAAIGSRFGSPAATCLVAITVCQFHVLFYSTRTLPNTFALCCVYLALADWIQDKIIRSLVLFTFAIVTFRFDVAVLFAPIMLTMWCTRKIGILPTVKVGVLATMVCAAMTIAIDSVLWRRPLWPEAEVLYYNTWLNKSSDWGTSPFHWYFTSALPRSLLAAYPMYPFAFVAAPRFRQFSLPAIAFFVLYSFLAHKEMRFIFYGLPLINAHVAIALASWYQNRSKSVIRFLWFLGCVIGLVLSSIANFVFFFASVHNYPSGLAMMLLHDTSQNPIAHSVHIDVYASMNGVTRFQKNYCGSWKYSKDPTFLGATDVEAAPEYTHLITSVPANHTLHYSITHTIPAFKRIDFKRARPVLEDTLYIMTRK